MELPNVRALLDCERVLAELAGLPLDDDERDTLKRSAAIVNDCIAKWATMRG